MEELLNGLKRTKMCGEFRKEDIDKTVVCMGFIAKFRNLGNLIFADIRDRSGIVQVSFDDSTPKEVFAKAECLRNEYVIAVTGIVRSRGGNINKNLPTGEIEIIATGLTVLSEADVPPFVVSDDANVGDNLRLKYRYLDLRRPSLTNTLVMRSKIAHITRNYLADNGFLEIETPFLGRSTPEGARDYLVPSRVHPGEFYALPQSPQQFKQLLMISGMDRYYQIARCFRDEDLRANRQPEFSQIDMEMSFVENNEDVMAVAEGLIKSIFSECCGLQFEGEFRRMTYADAMENYGSDKPDTRFEMKIRNVSDLAKDSSFVVFNNAIKEGGSVRGINVKGMATQLTRKQIDALTDFVKGYGVKGLAWTAIKPDSVTSSFNKTLTEQEIAALHTAMDAETGDLLLFVADKDKTVLAALGALRCHIANTYNLYDKNVYDFLWLVDFPMFEYSEEEDKLVAVHHPFTSCKSESIGLLDSEPLKCLSNAFDLVINGEEAGGGSVRISNAKMQEKVFGILGLTKEDIEQKFGYFVEAFRYGVPPHGGLAFGLDRLVMLVTKTDNIRDVIAFPKIQNASCLMTQAPSAVGEKQLKELSLVIKE